MDQVGQMRHTASGEFLKEIRYMNLEELYQEIIIDHAQHPRCHGKLDEANAKASLLNPLCGDEIRLEVLTRNGKVVDIAFEGHGCSISQASASMMAELCKDKSIDEARELLVRFVNMMKQDISQEEKESLGDAKCLEGVRKFSARIKCATLGWEALGKCLDDSKGAGA
jgi:nitrogen fixation NifU-like protein